MSVKRRRWSIRPGSRSAVGFLVLIVVVLYAAHQYRYAGAPVLVASAQGLTNHVGDFALLDQEGRYRQLYRYGASARAVVLFAHDAGCPTMRLSLPALKTLHARYTQRQVRVLLINANPHDNRIVLQQEAARFELDMPILRDESQLVVERLGISRAGETLVIDTRTWQIVYRGLVDDRMTTDTLKTGARQSDLQVAIEAVLAGRPATTNIPLGTGCPITLNKGENVSYAKDVAPILTKKCVPCHQAGSVAPWALDRYETVRNRSATIREAVMTQRMPPWDADPAYGSFSNDRSLSGAQLRALIRWIDAGSPRGNGSDPLAQVKSVLLPEWPLGKPDLMITVPPQSIPASGGTNYRFVDIPVPVDRDVWVRAVDLRPSNRAVTHHGLVFVKYPPQLAAYQPNWGGGANGFFAGYVPGSYVAPFPRDTGQLLPKGSVLQFQLHYETVGYAAADTPRLAIYLHKRPPPREFVVESALNNGIRIPPNVQDYPVEARYVFRKDALLHAMTPHMHLRGSRFSYEARYPDGRHEMLLSVPRYRYNWQPFYVLRRPKPIPAGTEIVVRGAFDNSPFNPANPDPSKELSWGSEMFIGYLFYSAPRAGIR